MGSGAHVGFQGQNSPFNEDYQGITHRVVDRPMKSLNSQPNTELVQPQYVFDSLNLQQLLPVRNYSPDAKLPPHISPFEVNTG